MNYKLLHNAKSVIIILFLGILLLAESCNTFRHLSNDQFLLRKNSVIFNTQSKITGKGEIKDNLNKLIAQKPNSRFLRVPVKLLLFNRHYYRLHNRAIDSLPASVERPVIFDTSLVMRSVRNMKDYLYTQGFFYAKINEKLKIKHRKEYVTYNITAGKNYKINKVNYFIGDSVIANLVRDHEEESILHPGLDFKYNMMVDERSRITALLRNNGYYKFTQENINFYNGIDTVDKSQFQNAESPFKGIVNYESAHKNGHQQSTVDLDMYIQIVDDSEAFKKFRIGSVCIYPDFKSLADLTDSAMNKDTIGSVCFRYHNKFVHNHVLYDHIYLDPGNVYSQADYDKTISKLTELGIFQYPKIIPYENRSGQDSIDYDIFLNKSKKHDLSTNYELSTGSTYSLGNSLSFNFRDRNLLKGANLLTIGVNGGLETSYDDNTGKNIFEHFSLITKYYGVNASIDFPKFLAPVASTLFDNSSLPHTIIEGGENVMDRVGLFTLLNTSAKFTYSWHQSQNIIWTFSPAFVNIIHVPVETPYFIDSFLDKNIYLKNSYKENFIEGENISFTFDNMIKKRNRNYSFIKLSIEEAGGILGGLNQLGAALNDLYKIQYAQYTKFDFDARHYFTFGHDMVAMRFYGGVGIPYGQSDALPYIKQYFAGGPYSLRGWRIRTLGPGSYFDNNPNSSQVDLTGDIKLEYNAEYRFPIAPLYGDAIKMNGAFFMDAGNIWLARSDPNNPGGNFTFNTLGQDIAADIGVGTRFDIESFLTLRVDVAMPVKKPYILTNSGWVFDQISPNDPTWRANNIIFNISIGYPF